MPIAHQFKYYKPQTLQEILELLNQYKKSARLLAGGTDLIVHLKDGLCKPEAIIDIKAIEEFKTLEISDAHLFIGVNVTFTELMESDKVRKHYPLLCEAARNVASVGVRNRATMVGNICSAVPSADSAPVLLVHEAEILVKSVEGERIIPITQWFKGPRQTALKDNEMVIGIIIPRPLLKNGGAFAKLKRYKGEDLAQAAIAVLAEGKIFRVALGAVGPVPVRCNDVETYMEGKEPNDKNIREAVKKLEKYIKPITDIRATKEYRGHITKVMFERAVKAAAQRKQGKGPKYGEDLI